MGGVFTQKREFPNLMPSKTGDQIRPAGKRWRGQRSTASCVSFWLRASGKPLLQRIDAGPKVVHLIRRAGCYHLYGLKVVTAYDIGLAQEAFDLAAHHGLDFAARALGYGSRPVATRQLRKTSQAAFGSIGKTPLTKHQRSRSKA